jgi:hypothetical protein
LAAPRAACRAPRHLGVRVGPIPTASRYEPPVHLRADTQGTRAASSTASYPPQLSCGLSCVPLPSASTEARCRTAELRRALTPTRNRGASRLLKSPRCRAQAGCHSRPRTPHGELQSSGPATATKRPTDSPSPTPPPRVVDALPAPSIALEQKLQRQEPPATTASCRRAPPYPVCEYKSVVGEPLTTPPPFPGRA